MLQEAALDLCCRLGRRFRVRGKPLTVAGVAKPPAHTGGVKPGQRRETHPNLRARSSGTSNEDVKTPRPVGVQGFESPPPHQYHIPFRAECVQIFELIATIAGRNNGIHYASACSNKIALSCSYRVHHMR